MALVRSDTRKVVPTTHEFRAWRGGEVQAGTLQEWLAVWATWGLGGVSGQLGGRTGDRGNIAQGIGDPRHRYCKPLQRIWKDLQKSRRLWALLTSLKLPYFRRKLTQALGRGASSPNTPTANTQDEQSLSWHLPSAHGTVGSAAAKCQCTAVGLSSSAPSLLLLRVQRAWPVRWAMAALPDMQLLFSQSALHGLAARACRTLTRCTLHCGGDFLSIPGNSFGRATGTVGGGGAKLAQ